MAFERYDGRPSVAFRVREADALALLADRRFFAPRFRGWICLAVVGRVDWKELEGLVMGSHRLVAPARLAREAPRAAPRHRRPPATPRRRATRPRRKR